MDEISILLNRGVEEIYPSKKALKKLLRSGKKLRVYQGFDPTGTQLHIGHMVGLMKLRHFQKLGHHIIFLIGDGTGQAGDPSGKSKSRKHFLTKEELRKNAKKYVLQARKIIKFEGKNKAEILYNSAWLNKLTLIDILKLLNRFTLQQLSERDIFRKRLKERRSINLREFIYPLLQGYDSVAMDIDLEIGGTDQTFNMLTGRKLVKDILGKEKFVLTLPLLTDSSGKKIGKTEGNVIALTAHPQQLFAMIMSLPDDIIVNCFELITEVPQAKIDELKEKLKSGQNPMVFKKELAFTIVKMLNDESKAIKAQEHFEETFQKKKIPTHIPFVKLKKSKATTLVDILLAVKAVKSKSQAKRLIRQKAIEINGKIVHETHAEINLKDKSVLKVGKYKFYRLIPE